MQPYYEEAGITIYHGDAREVLPDLTADAVLTDLPYGVNVDYDTYDDSPTELDLVIADTFPLMIAAAPVVALTCGIANMWRYPPPRWVLCWHQQNAPTASGMWGFNMWQPILVYGTDPYLKRLRGRRPDVVSVGASGRDLTAVRDSRHPCPKPLGAWKKILIRVSPDESDRIVDPFMGSGTTLAVAKATGRAAVGIELSERYCEIAAKRLAQGVLDFEVSA